MTCLGRTARRKKRRAAASILRWASAGVKTIAGAGFDDDGAILSRSKDCDQVFHGSFPCFIALLLSRASAQLTDHDQAVPEGTGQKMLVASSVAMSAKGTNAWRRCQ